MRKRNPTLRVEINIPGMPGKKQVLERYVNPQGTDYGRYLTERQAFYEDLEEWKRSSKTKKTWISLKGQSLPKAMKEFRDLYDPTEWYSRIDTRDHSAEIWYR